MALASPSPAQAHDLVYHTAADVDFRLEDLPVITRPGHVLLTTPSYFDVAYVINPYMEGNIGKVDREEAWRQWDALRTAYQTVGIEVHVLEGGMGLHDMVFCANTTLPYRLTEGTRGVVLSRMHTPQRRGEVPYFEAFFRDRGYTVERLPDTVRADFEGMGDAIWHPNRFLLWGGYGIRTDPAAYSYMADRFGLRVLTLALKDAAFYHLDTCFSVLDEETVLIFPGAFRPEGRALIKQVFSRVLEAPNEEARHLFACNAHCPDGRHVLIQRGCTVTNRLLREAGYTPVEIDTGEFLKAGGSVFCMKQMFW